MEATALWVFQALFNLLLCGALMIWLRSRRRIQNLESEVAKLKAVWRKDHEGSLDQAILNSSYQSDSLQHEPRITNINEKQVQSPSALASQKSQEKSSVDAYDKASELLSIGYSLKEVALRTGLSVSEIQLMGKIANKIH